MTHQRQRDAVDAAKRELDADGVVQVFALPEARLPNERLCTEEPGTHVVVYHTRPVPMSNGGWACLACGAVTDEPDGTA